MHDFSLSTVFRPLSSKARGGQVNKIIEIRGLGIHCSTLEGFLGSLGVNGVGETELWRRVVTDVDKYDYLLMPFDLSLQVGNNAFPPWFPRHDELCFHMKMVTYA